MTEFASQLIQGMGGPLLGVYIEVVILECFDRWFCSLIKEYNEGILDGLQLGADSRRAPARGKFSTSLLSRRCLE